MQLFLHAVFVLTSFVLVRQQYMETPENQNSDFDLDEFDPSKSIEQLAEHIAAIHDLHNHTFIALIDITFKDGTKRTCTGTIIHNNAIITARHCFGKTHNKYIQPEISASFVVIGSKKMFQAGDEQYLLIERIISHPKYRGWTADIALVFTFAGMVSEKHGSLMPLAGDKISMPKNSNLTILSWGQCKDSVTHSENGDTVKKWKGHTKYPLRANPLFGYDEDEPKARKKYTRASQNLKAEKNERNKTKKSTREKKITEGFYKARKLTDYSDGDDEDSEITDDKSETTHKLVRDTVNYYDSIFKNGRRKLGSEVENNGLSVQNFTFVNMQKCQEMMRKSLPEKYKIKNYNEFVCYTSENHFVTDEDAGAPAIRHGHLVAVTVGGVECDDDHVAVGIKVACFCKWIAENLPNNNNFNCCDNCCDEDTPPPEDDDKDATELRTGKKKKRLLIKK